MRPPRLRLPPCFTRGGAATITAAALLITGAAAPGCSSSPSGPASLALLVPEGCQPLLAEETARESEPAATSLCLAPYPSDFHRVPDARSRTGFRVGLRGAARPRTAAGAESDPHDLVDVDGASLAPMIVGALPGAVVRQGLPNVLEDPALSVRPESATVLLEADTGVRVAHYTDAIDARDGTHSPLALHPFAPLRPRTRYVVAFAGVRALAPGAAADAAPVLARAPTGFARLRDRKSDAALATVAPHFEESVFPPLARAGIARESLQLAWDFTTGSAEQPIADMLAVRELTLGWLATNVPDVRVTETRPGTEPLATIVTLEVTAPLFLDKPGLGGRLFRDGAGNVAQNGTTTFPMKVVVPSAVVRRVAPGRALAYGHGFFGSTQEVETGGARVIADSLAAVLFGIEWWGMTKQDLSGVSDAASARPEHTADFTDRVHQAMANWLVSTAAIRGPITRVPELHRAGPGGELLYDPSFVGYFGASQAHILGGVLAALDPNLSRVVLNVGGGGFTTIMPRSGNFGAFLFLLTGAMQDPLLVQLYMAMLQCPLDRIDPVAYARSVLAAPLPGSPADRRVLMQIGLGDPAVPNAASFLHARALGLSQLMPAPLTVPGLPPTDGATTSALTLFDFGIDTSGSAEARPLAPNVVHEGVRINRKAVQQMDAFLKPGGVILHTCEGPCDPE